MEREYHNYVEASGGINKKKTKNGKLKENENNKKTKTNKQT